MPFPPDLSPALVKRALALDMDPARIEERFIRGSGHGGQKINKTASCVQLVYPPLEIDIRYQKHREQYRNRLGAYKLLILRAEERKLGAQSELAKRDFKVARQKQRRSRRSKQKVLADKKQRSDVKQLRQKAAGE
ncbi:MAG: peptide chain release factor 1 [Candidatus Peribacteria bacterium]|nr:peptide chain release factor 1 [Candidatus Peribacteria bacterium]